MTTHVQVGDPPGTLGSGFTVADDNLCFCNCARCTAGSCCRWTPPNPDAFHATVVTDTTFPMWPTDIAGRPLVGYWTCSCRTIVPPNVEHRCPSL